MRGFRIIAIVCALALTGVVPALAAADASQANPPVQVAMSEDGPVFTTESGMTLYTYSPDDSTPGKSQCTNVPSKGFPDPTAGFGTYPLPRAEYRKSCVEKSPPLLADENARPGGDWSLIDRPEGGKQWTYKGHPLYTSIKDHAPGDINGAMHIGQLRGWDLAKAPLHFPPGLKLLRRPEGLVIATENGRPAYTPTDTHAEKVCVGCEGELAPVAAPAVGDVQGDWSIVNAGAGRTQYAFRGKPLYAAPDGRSNEDIEETGEWQTVIYHESAGVPAAIKTHLTLIGDVYTDNSGRTLYVFTCGGQIARDGVSCDDPGDPAVYWSALCGAAEECARRWRPYLAAEGAEGRGDWSVVDVADPMFTKADGPTYPPDAPRVKAWAYRGRPVYTFYMDKEPGDIWGHSLRWFAFSGFYALEVPDRGLLD